MKTRILFFLPEDYYFYLHWLRLARGARDAGFEVTVVTRVNNHKELIEKEDFKLIPISLQRRSKNIFRELFTILEIVRIYKKEKPHIVHHITVKPILYGSFAAKIVGIVPIVNTAAGLGFVFIEREKNINFLRYIVTKAFKFAFSGKKTVGIFQNPNDMNLFIEKGVITKNKAVLIQGTGVDINLFHNCEEPKGVPLIVQTSRMLWDKGVGELVEAARILRSEGINFKLVLVGQPDPENPACIPEDKLREWQSEGIIEWWGHRTDIPEILSMASIVVLPSYREGLPTGLLEAASCGRAIVTSDVPGCREIVRNNENGLLIPPRNPYELATAIKLLIESPEMRKKMGTRGREIVKAEFSVEKVINQTMDVYRSLFKVINCNF